MENKITKKSLEERFWSRVSIGDGCWEWKGCLVRGYGQIWYNRKNVLAHRISYQMANGNIQEGMFVCHKCDNPACVNPKHLFLGTQADNIRDCRTNGRTKYPTTGSMIGEKGPGSKISDAHREEIRQWYKEGRIKVWELATIFGVYRGTIRDIINHRVNNKRRLRREANERLRSHC